MNKGIWLFLSSCLVFTLAQAEEEDAVRKAVSIPDIYASTDSEGFSTYKYGAGIYPVFEHGEKYTGFEYQHNYFTQGNWNSSAEQYTFITKAINPRTALGYRLNAGYNVENGYHLLTTDSQYGFQATDTTRVELLINRDRVETQNSLTKGLYYTLGGASIEQQLLERLRVVVVGAYMYFSDTNTRPILRAKLIYDLVPAYGITAQIRYRQYRDNNTNVPNNYFNPSNYDETMLALGLHKRIEGWVVNGTAGVGQQSVNHDPSTTTQLYELAATSPINSKDVYFRASAGYDKSAGFLSPSYSYRYLKADLIFPFD